MRFEKSRLTLTSFDGVSEAARSEGLVADDGTGAALSHPWSALASGSTRCRCPSRERMRVPMAGTRG